MPAGERSDCFTATFKDLPAVNIYFSGGLLRSIEKVDTLFHQRHTCVLKLI